MPALPRAGLVGSGCPPSGDAGNGNGNGDGLIDSSNGSLMGGNWYREPLQAIVSLNEQFVTPAARCTTSNSRAILRILSQEPNGRIANLFSF